MGFLTDHPYTTVSSIIERVTTQNDDEDLYGEFVELLDSIKIQSTGPTEAARAIRKKLKYGSPDNQLKALELLELLVQNGGNHLKPLYNDERLLERLRISASDSSTTPEVKKKLTSLFIGWATEFKDQSQYNSLNKLYQQLPKKKKSKPKPAYLDDNLTDDSGNSPEPPQSSGINKHNRKTSKSHRKSRSGKYDDDFYGGSSQGQTNHKKKQREISPKREDLNIVKEKPKIYATLAEAGSAATNLMNSLEVINREEELSTENRKATECFEKARDVRRKILRYIQLIASSEEFLGPLIHANEELVAALKKYDEMSRAPGEDSDSEDSESESSDDGSISEGVSRTKISSPKNSKFPTITRKPPPIPVKKASLSTKTTEASDSRSNISESTEDDDPFGDSHKVEVSGWGL